jgi:hypothetical protein
MLQTFLNNQAVRRAQSRAYREAVGDNLRLLFRGFPHGVLPSLRQRMGETGLVRRGHAEGTDARTCSVQVAVLLIRRIIGRLSVAERQELALAFLRNDAGNPMYQGFRHMFVVLEQLNVSPSLVSYVKSEVAGQLRGMSQQAIFNAWVDGQIGGVINQLREQCLKEAELKRDLWQ